MKRYDPTFKVNYVDLKKKDGGCTIALSTKALFVGTWSKLCFDGNGKP